VGSAHFLVASTVADRVSGAPLAEEYSALMSFPGRYHLRSAADSDLHRARGKLSAKHEGVALKLSGLHNASGKIVSEDVVFVGFFFGVPGHLTIMPSKSPIGPCE